MHAILDHLSAILVGGVVLLISFVVLATNSGGAEDATRAYAAWQANATFTDVLEADLDNLGVQLPVGVSPIVALTADRFAFRGLSGPGGAPGVVEYVRRPAGLVDGRPAYRLERHVNGALNGGALAPITTFEVTLLDETGASVPASDGFRVRQVRVRVERDVPFSRGGSSAPEEALRRSAWTTTVRPLALGRLQ